MSEPIDFAASHLARLPDSRTIIDNLAHGAATLYAQFSGWPVAYLREAHIIGAERNLVELQRLLVDLRAFVPATDRTA